MTSFKWLKQYKLSTDQRVFFFISSFVQWLGIYLSHFDVHWILFVPPVFFLGAALNGYCFMMIFMNIMVNKNEFRLQKRG